MSKSAFSLNFRRILIERSLTLRRVSDATGIPMSTLSEWTAGREPKLSDSLLRLSQYLQVTLDELVLDGNQRSKGEAPVEFSVDVWLDGRRYKVRFSRTG